MSAIFALGRNGCLKCRVGICADDQQFLFDEFFQVDELSSTKYRGAGLGLTLVRDLLVPRPGQKLGYVADAADTPRNRRQLVDLFQGVDWLFIETRYLDAHRALAAESRTPGNDTAEEPEESREQ